MLRLSRAHVHRLLFGADRLLLAPRPDALEPYLMARLSDAKFHNAYRAAAFSRVIRFCLERHLFDVALAVHRRMRDEGFLATRALALRMAALAAVDRATDLAETVPRLKRLFEHEAYDVPAFMDLVRHLADRRAPAALMDDLAHAYVSARRIALSDHPDLVGELASLNLRAGRLDAAQAWLAVFEETCAARGVLPGVAPYSHVLDALDDIDPNNADAIQDVLGRMKSLGVSPDANVFNALIRANFVQKRYQQGFALYHVLMQKRSEDLMPNDVTYKLLFRAENMLNHPRASRTHKRPDNAVPPRRAFRDMLACHLERTQGRPSGRSTVVSVSAFHLALRTLMARQDYAAALVAVDALHAFGFRPNLQTYLIVFVDLLRRMQREASLPVRQGSYRLVDFITHLRPKEDPELKTLLDRIRAASQPSPVGIDTVSHLLRLGEHATHDDLPATLFSSQPRHRSRPAPIPTAAMLTGAEDLPSNQRAFFSPVPLARILYKALLGELFRKAVHRGADWNWKGAAVPIVEETRGEMIPGDLVGEEARSEGRREEEGLLPFSAARMRRRRRSARGGREIVFDSED